MSNEEWLDDILTQLENAVESDVMRRIANRQPGVSPKMLHAKAKQAILAELKKREAEARLDEVWKYNGRIPQYIFSTLNARQLGALAAARDKRLAELQEELNPRP